MVRIITRLPLGFFSCQPDTAVGELTSADSKGWPWLGEIGASPVGSGSDLFPVNYFPAAHFGSRNAVGRHFGFGGDPGPKTDVEIVGVMKDAKYNKCATRS